MFDVGFSEIMLIMAIALIVVGPERLPKLARTVGRWIGKARTIVASVKSEVEREIRVEELKKSIQQQTSIDELKALGDDMKAVKTDVDRAGRDIERAANKPTDGRVDNGTALPSPADRQADSATTPTSKSSSE